MRVIRYVYLAVCLFAGAHAYAQFPNGKTNTTEFSGRVIEGGNTSYDGLVVEIANLLDRTFRQQADVASDGLFWFRSIPNGEYQVRVLTRYGDELASTVASVGQFGAPLEIRLPRNKLQKPGSGTVSIQQLNHPPSKQVQKLLDSGRRLIQDQHYDGAVARFREAAKDDPDCPQAHADLGMALSRVADWAGSAAEYRAAIALDPGTSVLHSNLAAALSVLEQYDEAERETATALKLDPRNGRAHFVMAGVLLHKREPIPEVISHLIAAQETVPSARTSIQKICAVSRVAGCP
jgi:tetratricopeptide (TPR) repeat protein